MDSDLLTIVKKRENYVRFEPYIRENTLSKEAQTIFAAMGNYFKHYPSVSEIDWDSFQTFFLVLKNAGIPASAVPVYKTIFDSLGRHTATHTTEDLIRHYITMDYATRIASAAIEVRDGNDSIDTIGDMVGDYNKELGRAITATDLFVSSDISAIAATTLSSGYEWRLEELNISLGPIRKGSFVLVTARPETGKTTFAASEVTHIATQLADGQQVVWVNNEEESTTVMMRIQCAALGISSKTYLTDPKAYEAKYKALMKHDNRILVLKNDGGMNNIRMLNKLFRDINPAVIVFDQLDKVEGFEKAERDDLRLGSIYLWARKLSHEYGPVIALSQADGSAEGAQWIQMNQLRGSKTDKPGEADAIIAIGVCNEAGYEYNRYINIPKNKLFGGPRSDEALRHGKWEVTIRPDIARYVGTK